eukprot:m.81803 g.81803  ORF g.81803 m.81803 type:complete len:56 (+) comp36254_c0_seq1:293-460(+)
MARSVFHHFSIDLTFVFVCVSPSSPSQPLLVSQPSLSPSPLSQTRFLPTYSSHND